MKFKQGFTLIELLIAIAIIGLLAGIAYPSYQESILKSRRVDAQSALLGLAQALERWNTTEGTYLEVATNDADTGFPAIFSTKSPIDGTGTYYNLKIHSASSLAYVIAAEPVNSQAGNGILILKSTGARGWDSDNSLAGVVTGLGTSPNELETSEMCWKTSC
ncbi:type IV pilin protein [Psychromonas sp. KJ10-10]|uniref:type IV pilin protein n=1 Tax=Psychromonas sp. KJ10-10 TaxID=3391823 RepID=UPI0039B52980